MKHSFTPSFIEPLLLTVEKKKKKENQWIERFVNFSQVTCWRMTHSLFRLSLMLMVSWIALDKTAGQCNPVEISISGMYLRGHTFKTIQVGSLFECQTKCEGETHCQSYNVIIGKNICELNSRTKEARPQDFVPDWNRFYMTQPLRGTPEE